MPRRGSFIIAPSRPSNEPLIRTTKGVSTSGTTCTAKPRMIRLRLFASLPLVRIATPARRDPPNNIDISGNISIIVIKRSFHLSKYFSVLGSTCSKKAKGETITRIVISAWRAAIITAAMITASSTPTSSGMAIASAPSVAPTSALTPTTAPTAPALPVSRALMTLGHVILLSVL